MSTDTEAFLAHYGIMGMRWGVRKDGTKKASSRKIMADFRKNKDSETERLRAEPAPKRNKYSESFKRESRINVESKTIAGKRMVEKYGEKRFNRAKRIDDAKSVLIITTLATVPIAVILKKKLGG